MNRLRTSIRTIAPHATLEHAKRWAGFAGISAVTDITHLDCLGVPVFVSERPSALADRFTFGKGQVALESEVGAYMEAIEFCFAEPGTGGVETRQGTPHDLPRSGRDVDALSKFIPRPDRRAPSGCGLLLARAHDVSTGDEVWLPAELIFNPSPDPAARIFGSSSNGLASGNTVEEASLHALFELIERDIWSLEFVRDMSMRIRPDSLPDEARLVLDRAKRNGLAFVVRYVPNDYGMAFFAAFVFDPSRPERRFFNGGWGCHFDRDIALMRAVTEAAQSRLAFLHGGREIAAAGDTAAEARLVRSETRSVSRSLPSFQFGDLPTIADAGSLGAQWTAATERLRRVVDGPVYRVVFTPSEAPLQVVRLVVPLLENFSRATMRLGPRMQAELEADAGGPQAAGLTAITQNTI